MDKRTHLAAAEELLATALDRNLVYAALELRMTIEAIAYEKLRLYAPRLPVAVLDKWQPPQAMRALLEFEPRATDNFRLRISAEAEYGVPSGDWQELGEHISLKLRWVRKTYNKLGNYLHVPTPSASGKPGGISQDGAKLRRDLDSISAERRTVVDSTIDSSIARIIQFDCLVCNSPIIRNADSAVESHQAICLQSSCAGEHHLEFDDNGGFTAHLEATFFECLNCNHPNPVQNRKLAIGFQFKCETCGTQHTFVSRQWGYSIHE